MGSFTLPSLVFQGEMHSTMAMKEKHFVCVCAGKFEKYKGKSIGKVKVKVKGKVLMKKNHKVLLPQITSVYMVCFLLVFMCVCVFV